VKHLTSSGDRRERPGYKVGAEDTFVGIVSRHRLVSNDLLTSGVIRALGVFVLGQSKGRGEEQHLDYAGGKVDRLDLNIALEIVVDNVCYAFSPPFI
jgi:hypothetical protein